MNCSFTLKAGLLLFVLLCAFFSLYARQQEEKILYVVDSIPVMEDPDEDDQLSQNDISEVVVLKNKDSLQARGYQDFDGVIYVFTKAYRNRPDSLRKIPSAKQMNRLSGIWHLHGEPYNGRFIDYFFNGQRQGEGYMKDGVVEGLRILYDHDGNVSTQRHYSQGIANGLEKAYHTNGVLKQEGLFVDGKKNGHWKLYYPNGKLKQEADFDLDEIGEHTSYYSSGKIINRFVKDKGKLKMDAENNKVIQLLGKGNDSHQGGAYKEAIKLYAKAIELDSLFADAYFSRGTSKLYHLDFDGAVLDFDEAIRLEPYMEKAYANRAFTRIRRFQMGSGRKLMGNKEVTVLAVKEKEKISPSELGLICQDLRQAQELGDHSKMTQEAIREYCK